jgi:copper(I)-binding protein
MLIGLKKPLVEGGKFDLKLVFKNAGNIICSIIVKKVHAMGHSKKMKHTH